MSALWQERGRDPLLGYRILRIGLNPNREQLYVRVNQRAAEMFDRGLIEETHGLLARYPQMANESPFTSLGYKQAVQHLRGELTREEAVNLTQQGHRNFAKRQMTWFRREPEVTWLAGFGDQPEIVDRAAEIVGEALPLTASDKRPEEQTADLGRTNGQWQG
jgi:tRNA dimethylallyltransferase